MGWRKKTHEIKISRRILRHIRESDYDNLFEYLPQPENDEFEGAFRDKLREWQAVFEIPYGF